MHWQWERAVGIGTTEEIEPTTLYGLYKNKARQLFLEKPHTAWARLFMPLGFETRQWRILGQLLSPAYASTTVRDPGFVYADNICNVAETLVDLTVGQYSDIEGVVDVRGEELTPLASIVDALGGTIIRSFPPKATSSQQKTAEALLTVESSLWETLRWLKELRSLSLRGEDLNGLARWSLPSTTPLLSQTM
jgi:hypothetical protein